LKDPRRKNDNWWPPDRAREFLPLFAASVVFGPGRFSAAFVFAAAPYGMRYSRLRHAIRCSVRTKTKTKAAEKHRGPNEGQKTRTRNKSGGKSPQ
jgi:hypothetical protein